MVVALCEVLRRAVSSCTFKFNTLRHYCALVSPQTQRKWSFFSDESEGKSSVYEHALKFQRPSSIKYRRALANSVSLIGTLVRDLKRVNSRNRFGVHAVLRVEASSQADRNLMILLKMWDWTAEMCLHHLRKDDFIYVRGNLGSYEKMNRNGDCETFHEVIVKEINYVVQTVQDKTSRETDNSNLTGDDYMARYRNRLHLWQVFFANPYEWIDLRKRKTNPKQPDFRNRSTGEALWQSPRDPPWLRKQLQRLDSVMVDQRPEQQVTRLADEIW